MSENIKFGERVREVYDAAVRLWGESGVERHAEGNPGVPGTDGLAKADWNADKALLDGAIHTLSTIRERKFSKARQVAIHTLSTIRERKFSTARQVLLVCTVVSGEDFAQPFHLLTSNNEAGVQLLKKMVASIWCGERWTDELPSSCRPAESFIEGEGLLAMFDYYFKHHWTESFYISTFEPGQITSMELQAQRQAQRQEEDGS